MVDPACLWLVLGCSKLEDPTGRISPAGWPAQQSAEHHRRLRPLSRGPRAKGIYDVDKLGEKKLDEHSSRFIGWFREWLASECSLTHYTRTLELTQRLQSPPGSAVGPGRPARRLGAAGSTTNRRPDLERGPSRASVHTEAWAQRTARAPACCHGTAACCRLAAIESSFHRGSRQPPATHGVQPVVRLHCGR